MRYAIAISLSILLFCALAFSQTPNPEVEWYVNKGKAPASLFEIRTADITPQSSYEPRKSRNGADVFVSKVVAMSNADVERTRVFSTNDSGSPKFEIAVGLTPAGSEKFARLTNQRVGQRLALLIDGVVFSSPVVRVQITTGQIAIQGPYSQAEAERIARGIVGDAK